MSYNLSVDVKYFKTYCDLAEFIQSQVIKTSKTFLVGKKFYTPLSVHWTFELQDIILFLHDNNSNEIEVYFHQIPEYGLFKVLKLIHTEEIFYIKTLKFQLLTYFNKYFSFGDDRITDL